MRVVFFPQRVCLVSSVSESLILVSSVFAMEPCWVFSSTLRSVMSVFWLVMDNLKILVCLLWLVTENPRGQKT